MLHVNYKVVTDTSTFIYNISHFRTEKIVICNASYCACHFIFFCFKITVQFFITTYICWWTSNEDDFIWDFENKYIFNWLSLFSKVIFTTCQVNRERFRIQIYFNQTWWFKNIIWYNFKAKQKEMTGTLPWIANNLCNLNVHIHFFSLKMRVISNKNFKCVPQEIVSSLISRSKNKMEFHREHLLPTDHKKKHHKQAQRFQVWQYQFRGAQQVVMLHCIEKRSLLCSAFRTLYCLVSCSCSRNTFNHVQHICLLRIVVVCLHYWLWRHYNNQTKMCELNSEPVQQEKIYTHPIISS